ncbi:MAG: hypothetical protein O2960_25945, partial [Verrucomicrobia bacterium]|nr:hypothetical protein [Verrucomicrobiota bacterium]
MQGVQTHPNIFQVQIGDQIFDTGNLVFLLGNLDLARGQTGAVKQSREEMHRASAGLGGRAHGFAVNGQFELGIRAQVAADPALDRLVELVGIHSLEIAPDGRFTGSQVAPCLAIAGRAQATQLVLVEILGKLSDRQKRVVAGQHGHGGDGQNAGSVAMHLLGAVARIGNLLEGLDQTLALLAVEQEVRSFRLRFVSSQFLRQSLGPQILKRFGIDRIEEHHLGLLMKLVEIKSAAPEPLARADLFPVGRLITGSGKAFGIH